MCRNSEVTRLGNILGGSGVVVTSGNNVVVTRGEVVTLVVTLNELNSLGRLVTTVTTYKC